MKGFSDEVVQVSVARPDERRAALALALGPRGACASSVVIDRALAEAQGCEEEWQGLLVARIIRAADTACGDATGGDSPIVGAAWIHSLAGRVCSVTAPRMTADAPAETGSLLLRCAVDMANERASVLLQALVGPYETQAAHDFAAAGFAHTTDLLFLVAHCNAAKSDVARQDAGSVTRQDAAIEWVACTAEHQNRLAALVERTYVDSRDCPELDGVREIDDVLAGYRATGEFSPQRWLIAVQDGRDVGCLLLADHPADDQWELVYLGVDPRFRGRGLGKVLTHWALSMAYRANRARLVLAVDAANAPAIAIYRSAGFEVWDRRAIYLRRFDKSREM